jgi:hypothetical protein
MAGPQSQAFRPGVSVKLAATAVTDRVALDLTGITAPFQVRVTIDGTDNAYVAFGTASVTADATDIFMLTGTTEVFSIPSPHTAINVAAISDAASGCNVYLTAGNGM